MNPKKPYPVEVRWVDPAAEGGWKPLKEAVAALPTPCRSVGFLIHRDKSRVVLAQNFNEREPERSDLWADTITIPAGVVKSVRRLK